MYKIDSTPSYFYNCSDEIFIKILHYADDASIHSLTQVCKIFSNTTNDRIFWEQRCKTHLQMDKKLYYQFINVYKSEKVVYYQTKWMKQNGNVLSPFQIEKEGTIWQGVFNKGKLNGPGNISFKAGKKITGIFLNNELHGPGKVDDPQGSDVKEEKGYFKYGKLHGLGYQALSTETMRGLFFDGKIHYLKEVFLDNLPPSWVSRYCSENKHISNQSSVDNDIEGNNFLSKIKNIFHEIDLKRANLCPDEFSELNQIFSLSLENLKIETFYQHLKNLSKLDIPNFGHIIKSNFEPLIDLDTIQQEVLGGTLKISDEKPSRRSGFTPYNKEYTCIYSMTCLLNTLNQSIQGKIIDNKIIGPGIEVIFYKSLNPHSTGTTIHIGIFEEDQHDYDFKGIQIEMNNQLKIGKFKSNHLIGPGIIANLEGNIWLGAFTKTLYNEQLNGQGTWIRPDGTVYQGEFTPGCKETNAHFNGMVILNGEVKKFATDFTNYSSLHQNLLNFFSLS